MEVSAAKSDEDDGFQNPGIEMVAMEESTYTYTSLRDVLPASLPSLPDATSALLFPTMYSQIWHDAPIKDPLVKHAAWAYLQPMLTSPPPPRRSAPNRRCCGASFFAALKESGVCGCAAFLIDVVLAAIKQAFRGSSTAVPEEEATVH